MDNSNDDGDDDDGDSADSADAPGAASCDADSANDADHTGTSDAGGEERGVRRVNTGYSVGGYSMSKQSEAPEDTEEATVTQGDLDWLIQEMENLQNDMEFLEVGFRA
jgi:hypothetical protein